MEREIKATVNGYNIERVVGTKFPFYITIKEGKEWKAFHSFNTLKSAKEFASNLK